MLLIVCLFPDEIPSRMPTELMCGWKRFMPFLPAGGEKLNKQNWPTGKWNQGRREIYQDKEASKEKKELMVGRDAEEKEREEEEKAKARTRTKARDTTTTTSSPESEQEQQTQPSLLCLRDTRSHYSRDLWLSLPSYSSSHFPSIHCNITFLTHILTRFFSSFSSLLIPHPPAN